MEKEKQNGFVIGGGTADNNGYGSSAYPSCENVSMSGDVPETGHSETASYYVEHKTNGDVAYGDANTGYSTDGYTSAGSDGGNYYDIPQQQPSSTAHEVMAIISLISGILSLICCCFAPLNGVAGLLGLVFGILAMTVWRGRYNGLAIGGIITSVIGVIIATLMLFGIAAFMEEAVNEFENYEFNTDFDYDEWS